MTNRTDLKKQYDQVEAQLKALGEKIKRLDEKKGLWVPERGENFFYVDRYIGEYVFENDVIDDFLCSVGNCFPTEDAAERRREQLKVLQELRVLAEGWVWTRGKENWSLYKYQNAVWTAETRSDTFRPESIYFETYRKAIDAIKTLGSRLDILLPEGV